MISVLSNTLEKFSPAALFINNDDKQYAMTTPFGDFLFVGGITLLFFPLVLFKNLTVTHEIAMAAFALAFVINYPHFMHSYQLLYKGFYKKVRDHEASIPRKIRLLISGFIAPLILIDFLLVGIIQEDHKMLGYATNIMLFLVGWHYVKQGYGILMILSVRQKIFYTNLQKKILLWNAYLCWICFWSFSNRGIYENFSYGIPYESFAVPPLFFKASVAACIISSLVSAVILLRKGIVEKQICINGITAYICASYVWLKLVYLHPVMIYFFPALHSLQYLLFVWKMQYEKDKATNQAGSTEQFQKDAARNMRNFFGMAIMLGGLFFYLIPVSLDSFVSYDSELMGVEMFMYVFIVFINVHHYFIDFAIWRRDNPDMKYLFR